MRLLEKLTAYVAPYDCLNCGEEGKILCEWCRLETIQSPPSRCIGCQRLTKDFKTCPKCQPRIRASHVWVAAEYDGVAKQLPRKLKFSGNREAVVPMAKAMAAATPIFDDDWLVVAMPTITSHVRMRGFDHAKLLAKRFAYFKKLPFQSVLQRTGQTSQVGAKRDLRRKQVAGTMYLTNNQAVAGRKILLIDDVTTTGASLGEATRALKAGGARKVYAAVFAQRVL